MLLPSLPPSHHPPHPTHTQVLELVSHLPRNRQTLLFSATMPNELRAIMEEELLKPNYVAVDCVKDSAESSASDGSGAGDDGDGDAAGVGAGIAGQDTHAHVPQSHVILPDNRRAVTAVVEMVEAAMGEDEANHKIIAFFPTAQVTAYFAALFTGTGRTPHWPGLAEDEVIVEIHSRMNQGARMRNSDDFRECGRGVLFTSDVSARGIDYPDVTHVLQFGAPSSRDQYIHRLGRTGRAGKAGQGRLLLSPFEKGFVDELTGIHCPHATDEVADLLAAPVDGDMAERLRTALEPRPGHDGGRNRKTDKKREGRIPALIDMSCCVFAITQTIPTRILLLRY